jgi:hypothetical protein
MTKLALRGAYLIKNNFYRGCFFGGDGLFGRSAYNK